MRIIYLFIMMWTISSMSFGADMEHLAKVKGFFTQLNQHNLKESVADFYAADASFTDPVHALKGAQQIEAYYQGLYDNVTKIHFDYPDSYEQDDTVILVWKMTLETPKIAGGKPIVVDGNSVIKFNQEGKAIYHRDYFDMGQFIYEHVPVVGLVIRKIKERLQE